MFFFTCNASRIYESFTSWNKLPKKNFHDIQFFLNAPVCIYLFSHSLNLINDLQFKYYFFCNLLHLFLTRDYLFKLLVFLNNFINDFTI